MSVAIGIMFASVGIYSYNIVEVEISAEKSLTIDQDTKRKLG